MLNKAHKTTCSFGAAPTESLNTQVDKEALHARIKRGAVDRGLCLGAYRKLAAGCAEAVAGAPGPLSGALLEAAGLGEARALAEARRDRSARSTRTAGSGSRLCASGAVRGMAAFPEGVCSARRLPATSVTASASDAERSRLRSARITTRAPVRGR